jgi:hypothetical protein
MYWTPLSASSGTSTVRQQSAPPADSGPEPGAGRYQPERIPSRTDCGVWPTAVTTSAGVGRSSGFSRRHDATSGRKLSGTADRS